MIVFESIMLDVAALLMFSFLGLYYYFTKNFNFWEDRGVAYVNPIPFVGSLKNLALQKASIGFELKRFYDEFKGEPFVGIFSFRQPAVLVRSLELVKKVLVKDSQNFPDRVLGLDPHLDPLFSRTLFVMKSPKWKSMRNALSPTFTSGRLKNMFPLVTRCGNDLVNYLDSVPEGSPVDIKEVNARYTTDVIASCFFGIDSNTLKDTDSEFRSQLKTVFAITPVKALGFFLSFFSPNLLKPLHLQIVNSSVNEFVRRTLWDTAEYRETNGIRRQDFVDNLIGLKKKIGEQNGSVPSNDGQKLRNDDYAAQALGFLVAGFDTSSSTMSFALYHLTQNPKVQQRLRNEIMEVLKKHNNEITYEATQEMKYLDMVINETLRLYPILPFLDRKCLQDSEFPAPSGKGTVTIPAGTPVYVSLLGIHMDPEYFPDPEKFDPERFSEENKQSRPAYTHMPFGEGPRICIGMRFGMLQAKTGLIHMLSRYEVTSCKDTPVPLLLEKTNVILKTDGNLPLVFKKIQK